jgi:hypothetical protein
MRIFLTIVLAFTIFTLKAQDKMFIKYYDSQWVSSSKEKASFYAEFIKQEDAIYKCTSYYLPSNKLYGRSFNADTTFSRNTGLTLSYYESGNLRDSILRDGYGKMITENKYYENGNLLFHAYYNKISGKTITEGFDEKGKVEPNYIYDKVAEFPGGIRAWTTYLERHLRSEIPVREKAPAGKYVVFVTFIIDKEGNIGNVNAENDPGYGTKEEAVRVIENGPKWEPAMKYNKSVIYRHKQGITFVVQY